MATMAQAKRDFDLGYLDRFELKRWDLTTGKRGGWFIWLGRGNVASWLIDARDHEARQFKSLDSAVAALEQIGFKVDVLFSGGV